MFVSEDAGFAELVMHKHPVQPHLLAKNCFCQNFKHNDFIEINQRFNVIKWALLTLLSTKNVRNRTDLKGGYTDVFLLVN